MAPPPLRLGREKRLRTGVLESAHWPGEVAAQFCSQLGAHSSQLLEAHSFILRHLKEPPAPRSPVGTGSRVPARWKADQHRVSGGSAIRQTGRGPWGTGLDCSRLPQPGDPTSRATWGPRTRPRSWHSARCVEHPGDTLNLQLGLGGCWYKGLGEGAHPGRWEVRGYTEPRGLGWTH